MDGGKLEYNMNPALGTEGLPEIRTEKLPEMAHRETVITPIGYREPEVPPPYSESTGNYYL